MPIAAIWYFDRRVLYIQFDRDVTSEDVDHFEAQLELWRSKGIRPVHLIVNQRNLQYMPQNWARVAAVLQDFLCDDPANPCGWHLQVGSSLTLGTLWTAMMQQIRGEHTRYFETVGAALAFLREQDPVLPRLLLNTELA